MGEEEFENLEIWKFENGGWLSVGDWGLGCRRFVGFEGLNTTTAITN
jgi:hypothetical protein